MSLQTGTSVPCTWTSTGSSHGHVPRPPFPSQYVHGPFCFSGLTRAPTGSHSHPRWQQDPLPPPWFNCSAVVHDTTLRLRCHGRGRMDGFEGIGGANMPQWVVDGFNDLPNGLLVRWMEVPEGWFCSWFSECRPLRWVRSTKWLASCHAGQLTGGGSHLRLVTSGQQSSATGATVAAHNLRWDS